MSGDICRIIAAVVVDDNCGWTHTQHKHDDDG